MEGNRKELLEKLCKANIVISNSIRTLKTTNIPEYVIIKYIQDEIGLWKG